ncbi:MAG: hypothetical protein NTZ07_03695 [Candidatus Woesebacteria bacterium]|nr:hypothetical protein [Candidatus Woesebacteria bacterium]
MKYFIAIFVTAVLVFLGATVYYKGVPVFPSYNKSPVSTESAVVETTPSPSPTPAVDESVDLAKVIKAALIAKHGPDAGLLNITVAKIEGNYASGGASAQAGGGMWLAAKVNGVWKLVWDGNGQINCSDIVSYPLFPTDMIPECWDSVTQKIVKR